MFAEGDFVSVTQDGCGIGKIAGLDATYAVVEYFHSIGKTHRVKTPLKLLRPVSPLPSQTRCYFRMEGSDSWAIGRIGVGQGAFHEVQLPDRMRMRVTNDRLFVRCSIPIEDPLFDVLIHKGQETPRFHDWRFDFADALLRQRAASRGMSGLLSSRIELHSHQVEVIRRVLEDPVQRYLLADEVGLGKTIEAGVILRQYLIDDPTGLALVIVPPLLTQQWNNELRTKFDLDPDDERCVLATPETLPSSTDAVRFGIVVIDEAHHVAAYAFSNDTAQRKRYAEFCEICRVVPRVLLLSATPVLHHEEEFLGMLHLLDPELHPLKDLNAFRDRVRNRQTLGRQLLSFTENSSHFALKMSLGSLKHLFSGEPDFIGRCEQLEKLLAQTPPNPDAIKTLVRELRAQAAEGLRVHRRMLRTRRDSLDPALLIERNMQAKDLHVEPDIGSETETLHRRLEDWRQSAWDYAQELTEEKRAALRCIYLLFVQCAGSWEPLFKEAASARLKRKASEILEKALSPAELNALTLTPHFPQEKKLLQSLLEVFDSDFEDEDRIELLIEIIKPYLKGERAGEKAVVFSSFAPVAQAIIKRLADRFSESRFAGYTTGGETAEFENALEQFRTKPECAVFVCDASCEEGLNLQFATHAIHFDLPLQPNRLEQRIGRFDRFTRHDRLITTVLVGPDMDDSVQMAWYELLESGLGIFKQSIASLQFFVEKLMPQFETALFDNGARGLAEIQAAIPSALEAERAQIAEQEVLDSIDVQDQDAKEFLKQLEEEELQHDALRRAVCGWAHEGLRFGLKTGKDVVEFFIERGTLIPVSELLSQLSPPSERKGTFRRIKAVYGSDLCLYRLGEAFIDSLAAFTNWDDRGQAFAMWRRLPGMDSAEGAEILAFRLNYIVEVDLSNVSRLIKERSLPELTWKSMQRQGDALFPPQMRTMYMDAEGNQITDPRILKALRARYESKKDGGSDYNLAKKLLPLIDEVISERKWIEACKKVREESELVLREAPEFQTFCAQKMAVAEREIGTQMEQLKLRERRSKEGIDLALERKMRDALLNGLRTPRFKLDSVGFYIVSGRAPEI